MHLDLRNIPTYAINCAPHKERRNNILRLARELSLDATIVEGITCKPGYIGCMLSHLKVLTMAGVEAPFLVLEDDCNSTTDFSHEIEIPDDADLFYLGVSIWGIFPDLYPYGIPFAAHARPYGRNLIRLQNMLSTHAIVYLNQPVVEAVRQAITDCATNEIPFDIAMARLQRDKLVLAPARPFFYQDARFGGCEKDTREPLRCLTADEQLKVSRNGEQIHVSWSAKKSPAGKTATTRNRGDAQSGTYPAQSPPIPGKFEGVVQHVRVKHPHVYRHLRHLRRVQSTAGYSLKPFDRTRSIFFHIPKTAGVSVAQALYGNLAGGHNTLLDYLVAFGPDNLRSYFKFAFVRNPWDRVLSAFRFLRQGGFNERDRTWANEHLARYSDFQDFVHHGLHTQAVRNWIHFVPQYRFVCWPGSTTPYLNYIGYFENLSACFDQVASRLGCGKVLPEENRSGDSGSDYRNEYDNSAKAIVADIYATDIDLFDYDFESTRTRRKSPEEGFQAVAGDETTIVYAPRKKSIALKRPG